MTRTHDCSREDGSGLSFGTPDDAEGCDDQKRVSVALRRKDEPCRKCGVETRLVTGGELVWRSYRHLHWAVVCCDCDGQPRAVFADSRETAAAAAWDRRMRWEASK
jgi:RNase P subunit RPR2